MTTATQIAKENRDSPYELAKVVADTKMTLEQADKLANDNILTTQQIDNMKADTINKRISGWKVQADIFTKNGINVTAQSSSNPILTSVAVSNSLGLDNTQAEQVKAAKFSSLASTFRRDGSIAWDIDANDDVISLTDTTPVATKLLTVAQTDVAIRQEKGFDDNMRQHAANSSANMIGLLLSSENFTAIAPADVDAWRTALTYLNTP